MADDRIQHLVVLMMENRSFDHMFGYIDPDGDRINDLSGAEFSTGLNGKPVLVSDDAPLKGLTDPGHHFMDVNEQIFGTATPAPGAAATMRGFVKNYAKQPGVKPAKAGDVMRCFAPEKIPVLTTLALEFAMCDAWFSSVPGPTLPNRAFAHCASSNGSVDMNPMAFMRLPTIYESLGDQNVASKVYAFDGNSLLTAFPKLLQAGDRYLGSYGDFLKDVKKNRLAAYSFIEPRYNNYFDKARSLAYFASDQHPPNDVLHGEELIADVYEAIRNSDLWEETLLVVTYDEHGGLYDHVAPPDDVATPKGKSDLVTGFDFTRLGLRVPAVLISPYVAQGDVIHTRFEHASLPATARTLFAPNAAFLTERDAAAATFESALTLDVARTDTPEELDRRTLKLTGRTSAVGNGPLSDHQISQVMVAYRLDEMLPPDKSVLGSDSQFRTLPDINTEQRAMAYIRTVGERARKYWSQQ